MYSYDFVHVLVRGGEPRRLPSSPARCWPPWTRSPPRAPTATSAASTSTATRAWSTTTSTSRARGHGLHAGHRRRALGDAPAHPADRGRVNLRRSLGLAGAAAVLAVPGSATASLQQVLLPGPTPYPTPEPAVGCGRRSASRFIALRGPRRAVERVLAGVGPDGGSCRCAYCIDSSSRARRLPDRDRRARRDVARRQARTPSPGCEPTRSSGRGSLREEGAGRGCPTPCERGRAIPPAAAARGSQRRRLLAHDHQRDHRVPDCLCRKGLHTAACGPARPDTARIPHRQAAVHGLRDRGRPGAGAQGRGPHLGAATRRGSLRFRPRRVGARWRRARADCHLFRPARGRQPALNSCGRAWRRRSPAPARRCAADESRARPRPPRRSKLGGCSAAAGRFRPTCCCAG